MKKLVFPFATKPKKGKSHTVTPTVPKSQGPKVPRALSKKRKWSKSKNPPTETKVTSPKPKDGFEQSYLVSLGTVPVPQDLERDIQLTSIGLPSTIDEDTHNEGSAKTTPCPEGEEDILGAGEEVDEEPQEDKLQASAEALKTNSLSDKILKKYNDTLPLTKQKLTDKLVEASISSLDKSRTTINDLYKGLNAITELLKDINNAVKDDPSVNKKITEATKTFTKISSNVTEVLSLVKGFDFSTLQSTMKDLQSHALQQDEQLAAWAKSSTNMVWNLGSKISGLERAQNHIQSSMSSLKEDTHSIKSMMTKMYEAFRGQPSSAPSSIVTPTLALTHILANVDGENATHTTAKDPPSYTEGETDANKQEEFDEPKHSTDVNIEFIGLSTQPSITLAQPITIIHPEPVVPHREGKVLVPYTINGKLHYLTDKQIQEYLDKEEKIKKAKEEARLFAITKLEVIKVVHEEAKKLGIQPKEAITTKAGEVFKKARDAEHPVIKKQYTKKVRKSLELRKHKYDNYMWSVSSRLKPKPITDIKIHPKTKLIVIRVFRGINGRNFDVHKPFAFGDFGISKLDELREIIPKKKNAVVKDLMNSLAQRYERIRKIPEELGIKSALPPPAPAPEQASSKSSRRKRKHMELEPKTKIPGLEYNRALLENVPFLNNMVIKEPEFSMKLRKLTAEHPDQENLKSKKVKLEALRYKMD
ncbi:hypothetical protein Tco_1137670 [Tanacetum coccineum]